MKVIVIGGGPAGMLAAIFSARKGEEVVLIEKNEKLGKKLFITGKGRCNITNACDTQDLFSSIVSNHKFMYSGFYSFSNYDVVDFFEELGIKTKVERGDRVFPRSDKSSDVIFALAKELKRLKVSIHLDSEVTRIIVKDKQFKGVEYRESKVEHLPSRTKEIKLSNTKEQTKEQKHHKTSKHKSKQARENNIIYGDKVIIATGGISYPITGSTGDGYKFARTMGHAITKTYPSLVPFNIKESHIINELQGLSLRNIEIKIFLKNKEIYKDFGELLFTHFGVSGPVILSASSNCTNYLPGSDLLLKIDLKPALSNEQLDDRIVRDFAEISNKQFKNSLDKLLPRKLIPVIISLSKIDPEKPINVVTKEERQNLVGLIKGLELNIASSREFKEAIITQGGVDIRDINPSTMESKLVSGVYFAGEVLDIDGLTGGYNLQIAWSTGYLAGNE